MTGRGPTLQRDPDDSEEADARRFRWLLEGNGYFLEEGFYSGPGMTSDDEKAKTRRAIDEEIQTAARARRKDLARRLRELASHTALDDEDRADLDAAAGDLEERAR